jgi:hypothetical protein
LHRPRYQEHEQGLSRQSQQIKNTVWLTADVHYAASHYYDPEKAVFKDFDPFWEFVSGPLHSGTFGPGEFDNTFGPQLKFKSIPDGMRPNRPPSDGFQLVKAQNDRLEAKLIRC